MFKIFCFNKIFITTLFVVFTFFQTLNSKTNEDNKPYNFIRLNLAGGTSLDETIIYFDDDATDDYDEQFDALKMLSSNYGVPNIFTKINDGDFSINVLGPFVKDKIVPLSISINLAGIYKLSVVELKEFEQTSEIYLEDRVENKFYNLKNQPELIFQFTNSLIQNRFFLCFYLPVSVEVKNETCELNDGSIKLINKSSNPWDLVLHQLNTGIVSKKFDDITDSIIFNNLVGGDYHLILTKNDETTEIIQVNLENGLILNSNFKTNAETYKIGEVIKFIPDQQGYGLIYSWDMGNGDIINGDSIVDYSYLEPGVYTITLLVSNGECSDVTQKAIKVIPDIITNQNKYTNQIKIYPNPIKEVLNLQLPENYINKLESIEVKDMLGKTIKNIIIRKESDYGYISIYLYNMSSGYYILLFNLINNIELFKFSVVK